MIDVSHHIVEGYLIHRELMKVKEVEEALAAQHLDIRKPYEKLQYVSAGQGRNLQPTSSLKEHRTHAEKHSPASPIENFYANLLVSP